jgi:hypothetical protein
MSQQPGFPSFLYHHQRYQQASPPNPFYPQVQQYNNSPSSIQAPRPPPALSLQQDLIVQQQLPPEKQYYEMPAGLMLLAEVWLSRTFIPYD